MDIYPIKFKPILQSKIWGGNKLMRDFDKKSKESKVGESWELSGVEGFVSKVVNRKYEGEELNFLIEKYRGDFVGGKVYKNFGGKFPLLFKLIDASENLSIQLHPNDEMAKKNHDSFGKTEMWYVLSSEENSFLYAGFEKKIDKKEYLEEFSKGNLLNVLRKEAVKEGDAFFINSGVIHAIGGGVLIAEIQQTSDVTYRVYDWDRVDDEGNKRELHTEYALQAIDFSSYGTCKLDYEDKTNSFSQVARCEYFTTNKIVLEESIKKDVSDIDSFVVYICLEGMGEVEINNKKETIKRGETILIPAKADELKFNIDCKTILLEVYID